MGIGHRIKSINNPDMRVKLIKEYVLENFPAKPLVEYGLEVEKITTSKKPNLILNVDGIIACAFVDMLRNSGTFTREEAQEYIEIGAINSLFVLGRSIGFIGKIVCAAILAFAYLTVLIVFSSFRPLYGSEEVKAGSLPSSVGRHFLCATRAI